MSIFKLSQKSDKVILDFVGANVAKKLHAGHMRNLNIGESLRRILRLKYSNLVADNHWGDWGVNIGVLIWGWKTEGKLENYQKNPIAELTRVYVWSNNQKEIVENWEKLVRDEFVKLEQKDQENYALWQDFILATKNNLRLDLELMNVPPLELEQGESFYENDVRTLWNFLDKFEIWQKEGLARFFDFETLSFGNEIWQKKINNLGRCYLVSSSGYTSYAFRDVAARIQWARDLGAGLMITITGNEQVHHFQQVFTICHYLSELEEFQNFYGSEVTNNLKLANLVHIPYGFLTLSSGKMSSRKGNVLTIRGLFDQVQTVALANLVSKNQQKTINQSQKLLPNQISETTNSAPDLQNLKLNSESLQKFDSEPETSVEQKKLDLSTYELNLRSQKITLAALKWYDLNRGANENLVLNIEEILNFVGNTGVYQLYTFARINSILKKNSTPKTDNSISNSSVLNNSEPTSGNSLEQAGFGNFNRSNSKAALKNKVVDFACLNLEEKIILKKLYLTEQILEKVCQTFKPHLLCNHLFELCTLVNSWYGQNSVSGEQDLIRRQTLIVLCTKIAQYLQTSLHLLGIEVLEDL